MNTEAHAAIRESFHKNLPILLKGKDPQPIVYDFNGKPMAWGSDSQVTTAQHLFKQGLVCEAVLTAVCAVTGRSKIELRSDRKERGVARPRQVACFLMLQLSQMSLPKIGKFLGGRDHTTIIHANRVVQEKLDQGDELTTMIVRDARRELGL